MHCALPDMVAAVTLFHLMPDVIHVSMHDMECVFNLVTEVHFVVGKWISIVMSFVEHGTKLHGEFRL